MSRKSDDERSSELQDLHNKGQSDASEAECSPPHSASSVVFSSIPYFGDIARMCGEKSTEEKKQDNDAYFKGHDNAKKSW